MIVKQYPLNEDTESSLYKSKLHLHESFGKDQNLECADALKAVIPKTLALVSIFVNIYLSLNKLQRRMGPVILQQFTLTFI